MSTTRPPAQQARELRESLRLARELAEAMVAQAERVRAQCQQLENTLTTLNTLEAVEVPDDAAAGQPAARTPEEPARLAAMEMALQGRSREEIMTYLLRTLDEEGAKQVMDAVMEAPVKAPGRR
jgi:uncharacterized protein with GYD domain